MELLYTDPNGEIQALVFDATLKEVPEYSATPANHRVERGIDLTDNVHQEKDKLSVEAFVTNTPIRANVGGYAGLNGGELGGTVDARALGELPSRSLTKGATVGKTGKVTSASYEESSTQVYAQVLQFESPFDRRLTVHDILLDLKRRAVEVSVGIGLNAWDSMLIIRLGAPQDSTTGSGVTFAIDFEEVIYANLETVDSPEPFETRAERERRLGEQTEEEPTPDDRTSARRALDAIADALPAGSRGIFGTGAAH